MPCSDVPTPCKSDRPLLGQLCRRQSPSYGWRPRRAVLGYDARLRLNVHLYVLALDGVYVREPRGALVFQALPTSSSVARRGSCVTWLEAPPTGGLEQRSHGGFMAAAHSAR